MGSAGNPAPGAIHEGRWSRAEKAAARRAFDLALSRELEAVMREAKERAARISEAPDLWKLERWLRERRREIDRKFEFRSSVLPITLATLLRDGNLTEEELAGIGKDKLDEIRRIVRIMSEPR
jgi:hypothetical protein